MGNPLHLKNPVALGLVSLVSIGRGVSYLGVSLFPDLVPGDSPGPSLPGVPLEAVGAAWVLTGLFLLASMFKWSWFRTAAAVTGGAYLTWCGVFLVDAVVHFTWAAIVSPLVYLALFACILTLAQDETRNCDTEGESV